MFFLKKKNKAKTETKKEEYVIDPKVDILCDAVENYKKTNDSNVIGNALTDIGAKCPWGDWNDFEAFDKFMMSDQPLTFD